MAVLSTLDLIKTFGERTGDRCTCCGKFTLYDIKDEHSNVVVALCSQCDVEKAQAFI